MKDKTKKALKAVGVAALTGAGVIGGIYFGRKYQGKIDLEKFHKTYEQLAKKNFEEDYSFGIAQGVGSIIQTIHDKYDISLEELGKLAVESEKRDFELYIDKIIEAHDILGRD